MRQDKLREEARAGAEMVEGPVPGVAELVMGFFQQIPLAMHVWTDHHGPDAQLTGAGADCAERVIINPGQQSRAA